VAARLPRHRGAERERSATSAIVIQDFSVWPLQTWRQICRGDLQGSGSAGALHVAIATLWRADALVSYNFTHIVRLDTMVEVNAINRRERVAEKFLCQPSEVLLP
jgi:hypothetical protein